MKLITKISIAFAIALCWASCSDRIMPDMNNRAIGVYAGIAETRVTEAGIDDLKSGFAVYGG